MTLDLRRLAARLFVVVALVMVVFMLIATLADDQVTVARGRPPARTQQGTGVPPT